VRKSIDIGAGGKGEKKVVPKGRADLLPTGSTLLNLALSDNAYGGYAKGTLINMVGDSSAGKTFLAWHLFAEMVHDKKFKDYKLIYDDAERKLKLNIYKLFGNGMDRVERISSDYMEEFDQNVRKLLKEKQPFVYAIDSFDALTDKAEKAKEELKRDYPLKPRLAAEMFRKICGDLEKQDSLLVVVSQTRDNIGITFGETKTRSGGRALRFHAMQEFWLAVKGHIKRKGKEVGVSVVGKAKKNHLTGKLRAITFDILYDYGLDNIGSLVDWMVLEGFWKKPEKLQTIDTGDDFGSITKDKLVKLIDSEERESELIEIVAECWRKVENEIRTDRRPRYL